TGFIGSYGWCRLSDQATSPPWVGVIGSRPLPPLFASLYCGLLPLVISAKTQRIWLVSLPQAKLTWPGSEATLGFWQAVVIWLWTVATLGGQDGLHRKMKNDTIAMIA